MFFVFLFVTLFFRRFFACFLRYFSLSSLLFFFTCSFLYGCLNMFFHVLYYYYLFIVFIVCHCFFNRVHCVFFQSVWLCLLFLEAISSPIWGPFEALLRPYWGDFGNILEKTWLFGHRVWFERFFLEAANSSFLPFEQKKWRRLVRVLPEAFSGTLKSTYPATDRHSKCKKKFSRWFFD